MKENNAYQYGRLFTLRDAILDWEYGKSTTTHDADTGKILTGGICCECGKAFEEERHYGSRWCPQCWQKWQWR